MGQRLGRCGAVIALALACACPAADARGLETVLQDDAQLLHRPEDQLRRSLDELRLLGVDRIRVTAGWSVLTRGADSTARPVFDASDPAAYEQERWRNLDRLIVLARAYGFKTMIDVAFWAPHWASRDPVGERGRTEIDPVAYREFAVAVARRYSGAFVVPRPTAAEASSAPLPSDDQLYLEDNYGSRNPPDGGPSLADALSAGGWLGPARGADELAAALGDGITTGGTAALPEVDVFTLWNEPNHQAFMRPQWERHGRGFVPRSPHMYREMVEAAYPAIKAARPDATVLIGGTAYSGTTGRRGTGGVQPLRFVRELACVSRRLRPLRRSGCRGFRTVPGDGWAHHPYTMRTKPNARNRTPGRRDEVPIAEMPKLDRLIGRLIKRDRLAPGMRRLWITEYGYETNPPVEDWVYTWGDQAHFLTWAEQIASRSPNVRTFAQFLLRDLPPGAFRVGTSKRRAFGQWQSGLLMDDGRPKLAAHSFRAGLFARRTRDGRVRLWGRLRTGDGGRSVVIERRPPRTSAWRAIETGVPGHRPVRRFAVDGRGSFERYAEDTRRRGFRYRIRWSDGAAWHTSISVRPVG